MAHGVLVFGLNGVSQFKNAVVSPVMGTCSGNMKVVLIYVFSWLFLGTELNMYIWIGSSLTIGGGVWYGLLTEGFDVFGIITGTAENEEPETENKKAK